MSERVLLTVHGEMPMAAWRPLSDLCAALIREDEEPVVMHREIGDPNDGPTSVEWYVRSAK